MLVCWAAAEVTLPTWESWPWPPLHTGPWLELPDCADPACVHSVQTAAAVQTYMNDTSRERDQAFYNWQL